MYQLDINNLEQFDILLVRFAENENSLKIREACNSDYSHAIIHLGDGSFIEGIEPAVTLFSFHRYYFPDLNNVKVLRLNSAAKLKLNSSETEKALRGLSSCSYSKRLLYYLSNKNISTDIIEDFLKNKRWRNGVVCTSLITLPYFAGGIDISDSGEPFYAHFGDIENYRDFVDVTSLVFEQIAEEDLRKDAFDYFTTYQTGSILERQSEIANELNTYVQKKYFDISKNPEKYLDINIVKENLGFTSWEDIFPNIMRWYLTETGREIDNELSELLISTKYNLLWFEEIHKDKEQFFPAYYLSYEKLSTADLAFIRSSLQATYARIQSEEDTIFKLFFICPSKTFHILLDMYRSYSDLLRSTITQYDALINPSQI